MKVCYSQCRDKKKKGNKEIHRQPDTSYTEDKRWVDFKFAWVVIWKHESTAARTRKSLHGSFTGLKFNGHWIQKKAADLGAAATICICTNTTITCLCLIAYQKSLSLIVHGINQTSQRPANWSSERWHSAGTSISVLRLDSCRIHQIQTISNLNFL